MLGTFPSKEKYRRMSRFAGERSTLSQSRLARLQGIVPRAEQLKQVLLTIVLSFLIMPSVSATPGVVVGSYTDRANAQAAAENARRALGAISSEIEIHIVSQGPMLAS